MRMRHVAGWGMCVVAAWVCSSCNNKALRQTASFPLNSSTSKFEVEGGVTVQKTFLVQNFDTGGVTLGGGAIALAPSVVTFQDTDSGGGKSRATLHEGPSDIVVRVRVDDPDKLETVCDTGDEYGPYTVHLVDDIPQSVDPSEVELTSKTIDLMNAGSFTICIEVTSDNPGTVTISEFTLRLGL